ETTDSHPLVPPPQAGVDGEGAASDAKDLGEQFQKLPVCRPVDRSRTQADPKGAPMEPDETSPCLPRTHVHQHHELFTDRADPPRRLRQPASTPRPRA